MSLHAELLVRVLTHGAIHFVRADLEGEGQCGRRAGLDELRLPLDALPFDLESVWDAPRVGDGERDGACRDRGLRQLDLPLGELGGHRRGGARGSVRGGCCKCHPGQQDQGDVAGRNSKRGSHGDLPPARVRSEEHTSELQSLAYLVCRLLLEKKKKETANST